MPAAAAQQVYDIAHSREQIEEIVKEQVQRWRERESRRDRGGVWRPSFMFAGSFLGSHGAGWRLGGGN